MSILQAYRGLRSWRQAGPKVEEIPLSTSRNLVAVCQSTRDMAHREEEGAARVIFEFGVEPAAKPGFEVLQRLGVGDSNGSDPTPPSAVPLTALSDTNGHVVGMGPSSEVLQRLGFGNCTTAQTRVPALANVAGTAEGGAMAAVVEARTKARADVVTTAQLPPRRSRAQAQAAPPWKPVARVGQTEVQQSGGIGALRPFCRLAEVRRGIKSSPALIPDQIETTEQLVEKIELSARWCGGAADGREPQHVARVQFAEALNYPPLEIRFTPPADGSGGACRRRLIVQLPPPAPPKKEEQADDGAAVSAGSFDKPPTNALARALWLKAKSRVANQQRCMEAWVYEANGGFTHHASVEPRATAPPQPGAEARGSGGADDGAKARALWQQAARPSRRMSVVGLVADLQQLDPTGLPVSRAAAGAAVAATAEDGMSSGWLVAEKSGAVRVHRGRRGLGRSLNPSDTSAVRKLLEASSPCTGTVAEAVLQLLPNALAGRPIAEVVDADVGRLSPLVRSVGRTPQLGALYAEMLNAVAFARSQRVQEGGRLQPSGLFHVAIDCPGRGHSGGDDRTMVDRPEALLADVVRCLGKRHAFAIVGATRGASSVLRAVAAHPGLTNFVVVQNPMLEGPGAAEQLGCLTILQPTLIAVDARARGENGKPSPDLTRAERPAERLRRSLPLGSLVEASKMSLVKLMSSQMFAMFEQHEWRAHLPDLGATKQLPLLSRLAGGVNAWAKAEPSAPTAASSGSSASVTTEIAEDQPTGKLRRAPIRPKTAL